MRRRSFLVFSGTNDRAIVAFARACEACGAPYSVIARGVDDRIFHTRYRSRVLVTRTGDELSMEILEGLLAQIRRTLPDDLLVILPNSEYLNTFFLGLDRLDLVDRLGCELPLVERDLYMDLSNKRSSAEWFAAAGIRVPELVSPSANSVIPLVAKPIRNVGSDGVVRYPLLLHTTEELRSFLDRLDQTAYFAQEFIHGRSQYLLAYFASSGEIFLASQVNLAQQPHGKSIVIAETSNFKDCGTASTAVDALRERQFHGLAMLEFIVDEQGPCYIEMNPRLWGPLQLCLDHNCGIVEAFIGDALTGDPRIHARLWERRPAKARYLWLGGIAEIWRHGGSLRWDSFAGSHVVQFVQSLFFDVYLRRDSWKVFFREILGK